LEAMCHKQTDDGRAVYITCIPTTCCGEIFKVHNVEIAHVTLTTPTYETLITRQDFAWPTRVQNLKSLSLAVAVKLHASFREDFSSTGCYLLW